ncbi:MAG: CoA ester lyase [Betaproteobacteria bacterium]|jgi:citrate lyase subunit beta/citryl-CoA lyase|nr:CoA ester lyase [Betaproteobacteria bacterium]MBT7426905.1 CoA ester lyase [Betaproteobacteria bacterium]
MLYVPGCDRRYLEKAKSLRVDSVILDLGDPILFEAKEQSRENVVEFLSNKDYGNREVVVRVNDLDSPWGKDDIKAIASLKPDAVLFPNIESKDDVIEAISALDNAGGDNVPVMVMIESPLAVLHAEEIASASDRIACMVLATSDLISQMAARVTHERTALLTSLSLVILAARAHGRGVIDGIHSKLNDTNAFEYACRLGRDMGFDGKSLVHPDQLPYANDAYTPKHSEIAHAEKVIKGLREANEAGRGTVVVNERLIERHNVKAAEKLLMMRDSITELENE